MTSFFFSTSFFSASNGNALFSLRFFKKKNGLIVVFAVFYLQIIRVYLHCGPVMLAHSFFSTPTCGDVCTAFLPLASIFLCRLVVVFLVQIDPGALETTRKRKSKYGISNSTLKQLQNYCAEPTLMKLGWQDGQSCIGKRACQAVETAFFPQQKICVMAILVPGEPLPLKQPFLTPLFCRCLVRLQLFCACHAAFLPQQIKQFLMRMCCLSLYRAQQPSP